MGQANVCRGLERYLYEGLQRGCNLSSGVDQLVEQLCLDQEHCRAAGSTQFTCPEKDVQNQIKQSSDRSKWVAVCLIKVCLDQGQATTIRSQIACGPLHLRWDEESAKQAAKNAQTRVLPDRTAGRELHFNAQPRAFSASEDHDFLNRINLKHSRHSCEQGSQSPLD